MRDLKLRAWHYKLQEWHYYDLITLIGMKTFLDYENWCEWTGLKDKHGKEIYEGDIVKLADGIYEIIFEQGDFQTGFKKKSGNNLTDIGGEFAKKLEIIGNIWENPELIK